MGSKEIDKKLEEAQMFAVAGMSLKRPINPNDVKWASEKSFMAGVSFVIEGIDKLLNQPAQYDKKDATDLTFIYSKKDLKDLKQTLLTGSNTRQEKVEMPIARQPVESRSEEVVDKTQKLSTPAESYSKPSQKTGEKE